MWSETVQHVLLLFLTVTGCSLSAALTSNHDQSLTESGWRRLSNSEHEVLTPGYDYQKSVRGRSKVECIRECNKYSHCYAIVFNATTGMCYLQPGTGSGMTLVAPDLGQVYIDRNPKCSPYVAPESNGSVNWSQTLTSLQGKVTCDKDFVNTTSDVIMQCLASGSWRFQGSCAQHVWTNPPESSYEQVIPLGLIDGWSACVEGTPVEPTRFTVDLVISTSAVSLHSNFRFKFGKYENQLVMSCMVSGKFESQAVFPMNLTIGKYVRIKITYIQEQYKLFVDDDFVAFFNETSQVPASNVTSVAVRDAFNLTRLDTWCFD